MMKFSWIFSHVKLWKLLYKGVSQIPPLMFFSAEKELYSRTYPLKKTRRRIKLFISPVRNKILKIWDILFELILTEVQCTKNYFKISLSQEIGASGNNRKKEPQTPYRKFNIYIYIYILNFSGEYLVCPQSNASGSFLQTCINFAEQRLKKNRKYLWWYKSHQQIFWLFGLVYLSKPLHHIGIVNCQIVKLS